MRDTRRRYVVRVWVGQKSGDDARYLAEDGRHVGLGQAKVFVSRGEITALLKRHYGGGRIELRGFGGELETVWTEAEELYY
jgi:hypothetical protein